MKQCTKATLICVIFLVAAASSVEISDTLPIENNFTQDDNRVSKRGVEKFLFDQNSSAASIDKSKAYWWSSWTIGASLWTINTAYVAYQVKLIFDAIERRDSTISEPYERMAISLTIGSDIVRLVQDNLRKRSDYWRHKAVTDFNQSLRPRFPNDTLLDHTLRKAKYGRYTQDRVIVPDQIINPLLREFDQSRAYGNWSSATSEIAYQALSIGGMFLALAILDYIDEESVDFRTRQKHLKLGIGISVFGIVSGVSSTAIQKAGIIQYNQAVMSYKK